jgi:hypothetical protein
MTGNRIQTKTQPKQTGQGASCALPFFSVGHPGTQAYAVNVDPEHNSFSFLPPDLNLRVKAQQALTRFSQYCTPGTIRECNTNSFAANLILRFNLWSMNRSPYIEQRTSYVLYDRASCRMLSHSTRLAGLSARAPDQRGGKPPLLDTPPVLRGGRA